MLFILLNFQDSRGSASPPLALQTDRKIASGELAWLGHSLCLVLISFWIYFKDHLLIPVVF